MIFSSPLPSLGLFVVPLESKVLAESEIGVLAQPQEARKNSKDRRKKQIFFLGLIHSWRAVRTGEQVFTFQLRVSKICSVGGSFQCKMLFLPNIANFYTFTTGKKSA